MANVTEAVDEGKVAILTSLDVSKAFDSVNRKILLHKLEHSGFRGRALGFMRSYLSDRYVRTKYCGLVSDPLPVINGVIQGSPVSGTLFLIFENDIFDVPISSDLTGFADDSDMTSIGNSTAQALCKASTDLPAIYTWYETNRLKVNPIKSMFIMFGNVEEPTSIPFPLSELERVKTLKVLGLTLDETLSFRDHIQAVAR
jgi:hypothetical protein